MKHLFLLITFSAVCQLLISQNSAPVVVEPLVSELTAPEDKLFRLPIDPEKIFEDADGDILSYQITSNASWLKVFNDTLVAGTPFASDIGEYTIEITASDPSGQTASTDCTVIVEEVNDPPVVIHPLKQQFHRAGFATFKVSYSEVFADEEDQQLEYQVYSSNNQIAEAKLLNDSITVTEKGAGSCNIILRASDSGGLYTESKMYLKIHSPSELLNLSTLTTGNSGLTGNFIVNISEDRQGNLWFGGHRELTRLEGDTAWHQFNSPYGNSHMYATWQDKAGDLFFVCHYTVIKYDGESYTFIGHETIPEFPEAIFNGCVSPDNRLYITGYTPEGRTQINITRSTDNGWEHYLSIPLPNDFPMIYDVEVDTKENIWLATDNGIFLYNTTDGLTDYGAPLGINDWITEIKIAPNNSIWAVAYNNQVFQISDDKVENQYAISSNCLYTDSTTTYVGGTDGQLYTIRNNAIQQYTLENPLEASLRTTTNYVNAIYPDSKGHIWVGTNYGLYKCLYGDFKDSNITMYNNYDGLPSNFIYNIQKDFDNHYWIYTHDGLCKYDGVNWEFKGQHNYLHTIDKAGNLWFSTNQSSVNMIDRLGNTTSYEPHTTGITEVYDIIADTDNNIWLAGNGGLSKYENNNWINYSVGNGLLSDRVRLIFADSNGNIWIEYPQELPEFDYGISYFDGSTFHHLSTSDGLADNAINDFAEDHDGNIWLATYQGLTKFSNNEMQTYYRGDLIANYVERLAIDPIGGLWILYSSADDLGLSRFDGTKFEHITQNNGLPSNKVRFAFFDFFVNDNQLKSTTNQKIWLGFEDAGLSNYFNNYTTSIRPANADFPKCTVGPNPSDGMAYLSFSSSPMEKISLKVVDLTGRVIEHLNYPPNTVRLPLDLSHLTDGNYLIKITIGEMIETKAITIKH
ncbi:two-component regulator propeller domain-containing protein [Carboxylicivirga taeanensis]|uniref:two-component regulator propeller domain-containing protein n=1 Tax=Carboxylicivirga taeanensis TaxID=1416875 RepID=UPI003F6E0A92